MAKPPPKAPTKPEDVTEVPLPVKAPTGHPVDGWAHQAAGPSAAGSVDTPADASTDAGTDAPTDAHADARMGAPARVRAEPATGAAERHAEPQAEPETTHGPPEAVSASPDGSQGPRRRLEVAARSYKGGLAKLAPRVDKLADAVRDVLAAGGSPAEVRAMLAEVGLRPEDIPRPVQDAIRRR